MFGRVTITLGIGPHSTCFLMHYSILWAGVQPTLDPYAEAFYSRPIALTLGGEEFSVNDVCTCVRDCRVGGLSRREQLVRYL